MIKPLLAALFACVLVNSTASAKTFKLPDEKSVATITIPDAWKPEEIERGVQGQTPDDALYLAVEVVDSEKGMSALIDETFKMLGEHKVKLDKDSKKEKKFEINGMEAEEMLFTGKDEDGPTVVSIVFVTPKGKDKVIVLTYWVTASEEKKHQAAVAKILESFKPLADK
jgi:hypothetical protein